MDFFTVTIYVKLDYVGLFECLVVSRFWQQGLHFYFSRSVYYCELCESNCSGEKQLDQHLRWAVNLSLYRILHSSFGSASMFIIAGSGQSTVVPACAYKSFGPFVIRMFMVQLFCASQCYGARSASRASRPGSQTGSDFFDIKICVMFAYIFL